MKVLLWRASIGTFASGELPKPDVSRLPKELETQQRESLSFPCRQFVNVI